MSAGEWSAKRPDRLGVLVTPRTGNRIDAAVQPGAVWAADNDCFGGFHPQRFLRFLAKLIEAPTRPAWVACPDVVGDAYATWERYRVWGPLLRSIGLPVALVIQDGAERMRCLYPIRASWGELAAVFVGGSTAWKLSDGAAGLTREAHDRGLLVHWGRVNTLRRIVYLGRGMRDGRLWCDTFDGTGFSAYGDKRIPLAVRWVDAALADRQTVLFGGTA